MHRIDLKGFYLKLLLAYSKKIKIGKATYCFSCVIKQPKTIAHKMWQRVSHFKLCAYGLPGFSIKAVKEIGYIFSVCKIAFGFKENRLLC